MKRRDFLQTTAAGCVVAIAHPGSTLAVEKREPEPLPAPPAFELDELTISELQQALQSGKYSSRSLVEKYTDRIGEIDKKGPALYSVIELNPDAEKIATALDRERKEKGPRSPLHGIPILIKDNIDTQDRMMTTAGSLALVGARPARDAFVAQKLREAGAVILGKTNLSEWANFRSNKSSSGWSGRGGQTRNPYALDRNPCGSSSGSGAAVAANLCAAAIGTETDGSIVCPSSANSLVGIKPTVGLLSRSGIIPIAHSQDTPGPMARTVSDAAILLGAMTGVDAQDSATKGNRKRSFSTYTKFLDRDGLNGARIGVARNMAGTNPRVIKIFEHCIEVMKHLGAVILDPADVPNFDRFSKTEEEVLHFEFKADLNKYLKSLDGTAVVHSMEDLIKFNEENSHKVMPYFGQERMIS